jgi:hypothetical protein
MCSEGSCQRHLQTVCWKACKVALYLCVLEGNFQVRMRLYLDGDDVV